MEDERLNNLTQRVRNDEWSVMVPAPSDVRHRSDRRRQRRRTAGAFAAAVAVPAAIGLLASLTTPSKGTGADAAANRTSVAAPAAVPTPIRPTATPTPTPQSESLSAIPTPSGSPKYSSPADLALAKSLLATDNLPIGFDALPSCCYYDNEPVQPNETTCDTGRREGVAGPVGRTAQAMLPIRYTGAAPGLVDIDLTQQLATYASASETDAAMERHRETLELCRSGQDVAASVDLDATWTVRTMVDSKSGDDSIRWATTTEMRSPHKETHIRYEVLTRSGTTLQLVTLTRRPSEGQSLRPNEREDLTTLEDFARRGLAKLASPPPTSSS